MIPTTVSLFCGAGGESLGKHFAFQELGLRVEDVQAHAVNHWDLAVAAHGRNLPWVHVRQEDLTAVSAADFGLDRIDLLWASPSCVHFSRARGGQPKEDQQRSHAWEVVDRWLRVAQVDVMLVENVPEFQEWGPLDETGQPIKARRGEFFRAFVEGLRALGYEVDWRVLCAADYGDPTSRRRFFLQAVKDGRGIRWPEPTHRDSRKPPGLFEAALPPWRTAAEIIDWSIPCPSIFDRKRPLAEATLRRIAAGVVRFVLNGRPFIVNLTHGGRLESADDPLRTVTTANRGEKAIVAPTLVGVGGRAAQTQPRPLDRPMGTTTTKADAALVTAFLAKYYGGVVGQPLGQPAPTVTAVDHTALVAASMVQLGYGERKGQAPRVLDIQAPLGAVVAGGGKHGLVAASLQHYYSTGGQHQAPDQPLHAVTTLARHGLVTVEIDGESYIITDIGMRMLEPKELARAMGFPDWYRWEGPGGKPLTKRDQVKMIGNAVPTGLAKALVKAVVLQRPQAFGLPEVA